MYCNKCGNPLEDGAKFCYYCGTPAPERKSPPPRKKKKKLGWLVGLLVCLWAVVIGLGLGLFLKHWNGGKDESWMPQPVEDISQLKISTMEDGEAGLILYAEDTLLPEKEAAEKEIRIRIPQTMALETLEVCLADGTVLTAFDPAYLKASEETAEVGGMIYLDYSAVVTIPGAEDGETATVIFVRMGAAESSRLVLYRDIPVTDAMIEDLAGVLDDAVAYVNSLGKPVMLPDGRAGYELDPSVIPEEVLEFLEDHDDVEKAWLEEGTTTVYFVTEDGLCGAFSATQVYEDPELNYAGSGVTTDTAQLETIFEYDKSFRTVAVDPDVLVMCPQRADYDDRKGNQSESVGRDLAEEYGGTFTLVTNESDPAAPFYALQGRTMDQYGTVMLVAHSGTLSRGDGTSAICPTIYTNKDMDSANAAFRAFCALVSDADKNCLMYADGGDYSTARLVFHVNYTYGFFDYMKIFPETHYDILATSSYFMDLYADSWFPNTVFYLGACSSYCDATFNQFLMNHGAACVIGYNASVQVNVEQTICNSIFRDAMKENGDAQTSVSVRNYSIEEARDRGYNFLMESLAGYSSLLGGTVDASLYGTGDFVYEGYGKVSGTVRDTAGNPLSDITVTAYRYWNGSLVEEKEVRTDPSGNYSFKELPWGMYLLQAQDGTVEDFYQLSFDHQEKTGVNFVLERTEILVYVHNEDGAFLRNASVTCADDAYTYNLNLTVDDSGNPVYRLRVNAGSYYLSVTCKGYEGKNETLHLDSGTASRSYTLKKSDVPEDGIIYNGHYYRIYAIKSGWGEARSYCAGLGGHLVTITSQGEQDAVFSYMQSSAPDTDLWIGFSDAADEGNWSTWITGELVIYDNWSPDEPDDDNGRGQDYGVICNGTRSGSGYYIAPGQWDDIDNSDGTNLGYFICEWDYIPEGIE